MTDIKKIGQDKGGVKRKKLQLNKETLKDLSPKRGGVKGGMNNGECTRQQSGCTGDTT